MALRTGAVLTFDSFEVQDNGTTLLKFVCTDPGPGEPTDYTVTVTDAELAAATTTPLLRTLIQGKLDRKIRAASGISTRLSPFVGQTLTV
jgi:hypothetical protein